jgi:gliding motility associated protien GldN
MTMRPKLHYIVLALIPGTLHAQTVLDGAYIRETAPTRRAIPYTHLREADVLFAKRVWRTIDLREKINQPLLYPLEPTQGRRSLFDVILDGLLRDGTLTAFNPGALLQDDSFYVPFLRGELEAMLSPIDTVWTPSLDDPDTNVPVPQANPITSKQVTRYELKEDWFFDKQRGVMDVRIIGIAPLREVRGPDGELRGHAPLFWLYYPELRHVLASAECFNRRNDGARITYEEVFAKRQFSSWVRKESNVNDRYIGDYATGIDALLEAERVKEELFRFEHDLWNY